VPQKIAPGDLADLISATCYRRDVRRCVSIFWNALIEKERICGWFWNIQNDKLGFSGS